MTKDAGLAIGMIAPDTNFAGATALLSDNDGAGQEVGRHLLALGHRRVAFIGGERDAKDTQKRLEGLKTALGEAGVSLGERHVHFYSYKPEDGAHYAEKWCGLKRSTAPTAVVFANDAMALGFLRVMHERAVEVPKRVSVVGFDDLPIARWVWPRLTSVRQPLDDMGRAACIDMIRHLEGDAEEQPTRTLRFSTELIVRESTGPAPRR
jgi:LacI family transcriptional regulator